VSSLLVRTIDLNADLGEHDGDGYASDEALLDVVTSASIACGAHAGSRDVMERTVVAALERGVSIGAHPSYPDREGFGRREMAMSLNDIAASFAAQIEQLRECCDLAGASLKYVKPHGALYNLATRDRDLAHVLAGCIRSIDPRLAVLALPGGELENQSFAAGLAAKREAFIDRGYTSDGALAPRGLDGAVFTDPATAAERAVQMTLDGTVTSVHGDEITVSPQSLCIHSDGPTALAIATLARRRLVAEGVTIRAFA
jgi:5-oxoprolinase (ATP-hydrolysing) subunit A